MDDVDGALNNEVFPLRNGRATTLVDFSETDRLMQSVKRELLTHVADVDLSTA